MTAPRVTSTSRKAWRCSKCHTTLGHVTGGGDLVVDGTYDHIEPPPDVRVRTEPPMVAMVQCRCGQTKAFWGRGVRIPVRDTMCHKINDGC